MINIAFLIMIKYNIYLQEIKCKKEIETIHINCQLRFPDDKDKCSIQSLINEYFESKINNYPAMSHAYHFGYIGRCCTREILVFNQRYQSYCKYRIETGNQDEINFYSNALIEAQELYKCYDLLDDSFCDGFSMIRRRRSLNDLKKLIGEESFYNGILPPSIPIWRFKTIE
jgi:hypothetical protein